MTDTHNKTLTLGQLDTDTFLKEYWQKKPLLIKNAITDFQNPLDAHEIAGLSLDEESASRLIIQRDSEWSVQHGPLEESDFSDLPETNWTLLAQHADALDPEVNQLLALFRFLPNWRLDDIMVSYATHNGGVGPHFDYYDVFLLQGSGKRRWRIGQTCDDKSPLEPGLPMKILSNFETQHDWIVEPGDLIYIPAKLAHWGEAIDESITYSIGFRSPSHNELLLDSTQHFASCLNEDNRYYDGTEITENKHPGEIPKTVLEKLQNNLLDLVNQPEALANWLGEYATQLKPNLNPETLPLDFAEHDDWNNDQSLQLSSFCRSAFVNTHSGTTCFINGDAYIMSQAFAETLSGYSHFKKSETPKDQHDIVTKLIEEQKLIVTPT